MKLLLLSIGTRGDMEPFLAIGEILAAKGHEVVCVMPAQFEDLVRKTGLGYRPLDARFLELIEGETGRAFMGQKGSIWNRIRLLWKVGRSSIGVQKKMLQEQRDYLQDFQPDRILYHPKCLYGRHWGMANPDRAFLISPIPNWLHPVKEYPHIAFSGKYGPRTNRFTYRLVNYFTAIASAKFGKKFASDFPSLRMKRSTVARHMKQSEQCLYTVSPSLFPRPPYWPETAQVVGYFERHKTANWAADDTLLKFLAKHQEEKIVFITFGSMINADPIATTKVITEVLSRLEIPAIINTSSGGLVQAGDLPDHIHVVNGIPYDWIFPKVYAVIHHGGSGTTHTTIKHACANLIIPHIVDQFFWNRRCSKLGFGPKGVKIKRLNTSTFEPLLLDLLSNENYKSKALEYSLKMKEEGDHAQLLSLIT